MEDKKVTGADKIDQDQILKEKVELLQLVTDACPVQISVMDPVRNEKGEIKDFNIRFTNPELDKETGRNDLRGKLYVEEYPGVIKSGLLEIMIRVFETGDSEKLEYYYPYDGFDKWYSAQFIKSGNSLICTNNDITEKKKSEHERYEQTQLLQATLDTTQDVIQVFKAVRDKENAVSDFSWLLTNRKWKEHQPDMTGKNLLLEKPFFIETGLFDHFVKVLESGESFRGERFFEHEDFNGWYNVSIVKLEDGVVMATENITGKKESEAELVRLKLQQQKEVINAIIDAQETERLRIGEALHNGVAQLLYAIQTRLQMLKPDLDNEKIIAEVLEITADAIKDTRQIAFELVPVLIRDFGLEKALSTLFNRIVPESVLLSFNISGEHPKIPETLQVAIYRIIQELVNNVVKHSGASMVTTILKISDKEINIEVSDNGKGFDVEQIAQSTSGLGLKTVKNRVYLLDGKFSVKQQKKGVAVVINIPLED